MKKDVGEKELFQKFTIYKKTFPKQFKIAGFYCLILISIIFIYSWFSYTILNDNFAKFALPKKNSWSWGYFNYALSLGFLSSFSYSYIYKAYKNIRTNFLTLKKYSIWIGVFSIISLIYFIVLILVKQNLLESTNTDLFLQLVGSITPINWIVFISFSLYNWKTNKKEFFVWKKWLQWIGIRYLIKLFYFLFFIILGNSIFKYIVNEQGNFFEHPFVYMILSSWNISAIFIKMILILIFILTAIPSLIRFMSKEDLRRKEANDRKMGIAVSLSFLISSLVWTIQKFSSKMFMTKYNTVFLLICLLAIFFILFISFVAKNELNSSQVRGMYFSWTLLIVWITFIFIRIIFDYKTETKIKSLQISDINLMIAIFTNIFIVAVWISKNNFFYAKEAITLRLINAWLLTTLTLIFIMKINGIYFFINDNFRIDMLFFVVIIIGYMTMCLLYSFKQMIIYKNIKKIRSYDE